MDIQHSAYFLICWWTLGLLPYHYGILFSIVHASKFSFLWPKFELFFFLFFFALLLHHLFKILHWLFVARNQSFSQESVSSAPGHFVGWWLQHSSGGVEVYLFPISSHLYRELVWAGAEPHWTLPARPNPGLSRCWTLSEHFLLACPSAAFLIL